MKPQYVLHVAGFTLHNLSFLRHASRLTLHGRRGQAMILTVLALGGTLLGATTIAGLLTVYQIRQTTDLANSAKAIFAADAGIEWGLYQQFFRPEGTGTGAEPVFLNGASVQRLTCENSAGADIPCTDPSTVSIRSVGTSAQSSRALRLSP